MIDLKSKYSVQDMRKILNVVDNMKVVSQIMIKGETTIYAYC